MIGILEEANRNGLPIARACAVVGLDERRFRRWRKRADVGDYDRHRKPANIRPWNALLPDEGEAIERAVARREWADMSCDELSVRIMEEDRLYVSPVAIWEYQKSRGLAGHRGRRRNRGRRRGEAPDTSFMNGPNQLWDYDISKLRSGIPRQFWYLYVILDQYSRKVISWLISRREISDKVQEVWDQAILAEGLEAGPTPKSLSDRGSQMRSRSTREFFRELGIDQLFARPRTPNDNPFIESLFSTTKTHPDYPGWFSTPEMAVEYFDRFFPWYNGQHLHTRIGMVTPNQKHSGEWVAIVAEREAIRARTLERRRVQNCGKNETRSGVSIRHADRTFLD